MVVLKIGLKKGLYMKRSFNKQFKSKYLHKNNRKTLKLFITMYMN